MSSLFTWFLSPWGLVLLAALESSPVVFLPFANDFVVIYLAARSRQTFWLYPLLATAGALIGTAVSRRVGVWIGEEGLERFVSKNRLDRVRRRVRKSGAVELGLLALLPPPFPFTPFMLASGVFEVSARAFLTTVGIARLVRFGIEAWLAQRYGHAIVRWMESTWFREIVWGFVVLVLAGTAYSVYRVTRRTRPRKA